MEWFDWLGIALALTVSFWLISVIVGIIIYDYILK